MTTSWRILIVDDLPVWAASVRSMAQRLNGEVRLATNLKAAVRALRHWEPHLVLLDLHMPRDTWEPIETLSNRYAPHLKTLAFCEQITSHPDLTKVMVVMTSVEEQPRLQELAAVAGAHDFYTKDDFNTEKLRKILEEVAHRNPEHKPTPPKV